MTITKSNLYTIKDISEITGVHAQTLRNWEKENLIEPIRVAGNQRIYTDEHVKRVEEILKLKEEGLQLKGIRNVLLGKGPKIKATQTKTQPSKTLMSAAQTLEKTGAKKRGRPAKNVTTPTENNRGKYSVEELSNMTLKELTEIAQREGIKYFRQMFKEELITAIADPSRREEMKERAKERTKNRYGHKVYGERRRKLEEEGKLVQYAQAQETNRNKQITEESDIKKEGLVEANVVEDAQEEFDNQQVLIKKILELGEKGKTPEEIAKFLVNNYKG